MIGRNLVFGEESDDWRVSFAATQSTIVNVAAIGGGIGGGVLILLVVFLIVVVGIIVLARKNSRKKDMRFIKLMSDMERMEVEMAVTCKTGVVNLYYSFFI